MKVSGSATDIEATQTLPKNQRAPCGLSEPLGDSSIRMVGGRLGERVVVGDPMLSQARKTINIMELWRVCPAFGQPSETLQGRRTCFESSRSRRVEAKVQQWLATEGSAQRGEVFGSARHRRVDLADRPAGELEP